MTKRKYSNELKVLVVQESRQIGNIALVARRHNISRNTVYGWVKKAKEYGSIKLLPKNKERQFKEIKRRVNKLGNENNQLKKLLAEKELELAILRDLRDQINPQ
jgi:transposase